MYVCMYVYVCAYICVYVCVCLCMYVYFNEWKYVCMYDSGESNQHTDQHGHRSRGRGGDAAQQRGQEQRQEEQRARNHGGQSGPTPFLDAGRRLHVHDHRGGACKTYTTVTNHWQAPNTQSQ